MSGQDFGCSLFEKAVKELPVAEEGTKAGVAELQAFAHEESMNFFLVRLSFPSWSVSWDGVKDTNARNH